MDTHSLQPGLPTDRAVRRETLATAMDDESPLLSKQEFAALMDALFAGHAELGTGGTQLELHMVYKWAEGVRVDELMRRGVLSGEWFIDIDPDTGEIIWGAKRRPENASVNVAAERLLTALLPVDAKVSLNTRAVAFAFVANRVAEGRRVTPEEMTVIIDWMRESVAKSALLDLVIAHPATLISIGPDGGIAVRIGYATDRTQAEAA